MTPKQFRMISYKAKSWAVSKGFYEDADDIAQNALLRFVKDKDIRVASTCIDYVREQYGRTGKRGNSTKNKHRTAEKRTYTQITDEFQGVATEQDDIVMSNIDFNIFQNYLEDSKDRAFLTLRFKWGLTEKEIGDCFGLSTGRVSQKLKEIKAKLSQFIDTSLL